MTKPLITPGDYAGLYGDIVGVVESARRMAARSVNAVTTATYWEIGRRIVASEQGGQARAGYGQALIARLAGDLTRRFGRGFGKATLASMRAFYLAWPASEIFQTTSGKSAPSENVQTPSGKLPPGKSDVDVKATAPDYMALATRFTLPWPAYVRLLAVKTVVARAFYETEALREDVPPVLAVWSEVKVHTDGHVVYKKALYSVPFTLVSKQLWLKATDTVVQAFHRHELVAIYPRLRKPGDRHTVRDHQPPEAQAWLEHDPQWCLARAKDIGPACHAVSRCR